MTGAIEFLQHAREMCDRTPCYKCPCYAVNDKDDYTVAISICEDNCMKCKMEKNNVYCPFLTNNGMVAGWCKVDCFMDLTDKEIADLVREVEKWHRERSKDE